MYDVLCHAVDLLFQGLFTSVFVLLLAIWHEKSAAIKKAKTAVMFISVEIDVHIAILSKLIEDGKTLKENSSDGLSCSYWEEFRRDLPPLVSLEHLKALTQYYHSIQQVNSLLFTQKPTRRTFYTFRKHLESAIGISQILKLSVSPARTYQSYAGSLLRLKHRIASIIRR